LLARGILHEVEEKNVVKVGSHLLFVVEVEVVVEFGELQQDLHGLWLVIAGETAMLLSVENALAALEDEVGADGVLRRVQCLVECLLLWKQDYRAAVFRLASLVHCALDVTPDIGRVVPVQVDYCFWLLIRGG